MSICRPGVESGISASLTSPQVLPVQLVYRVAGEGGGGSEAETHNPQELCGIRKPGHRTEGRSGGVSEISLSQSGDWMGCGGDEAARRQPACLKFREQSRLTEWTDEEDTCA